MKSILVLGGGFGGLQCALRLIHNLKKEKLIADYEVILVDQNSYHTYTPTLYDIATTSDAIASNKQLQKIVTFSLQEIVSGAGIKLIRSKVLNIDPARSEITLENDTRISYSYLVLALGAQVNYFDIPGLSHYARPLKTFADALRIREQIIELTDDETIKDLRIVVGGGGSTGIELAAEIKLLLKQCPRISRGSCTGSVTIIDGAPSILSQFKPSIIKRAERRLADLGVTILSNRRITNVSESEISLGTEEALPYDLLLWTGGVAPHQLMGQLGMKKDQSGRRVIASEHMICLPEHEDLKISGKIFGIGDAVCFINPKTGKPVPGVARAAIVQGWTAAHNITQMILADEDRVHTVRLKRYHPREYPYILPVGGKFAIAQFGAITYSGICAWITKGLVELNYLVSIFSLKQALYYWFKGLFIFLRNNKL